MRKIFTLILTLIIAGLSAFSQQETDVSKTAIKNFESKYNAGKYEAIFDDFSTEMQKALPLEKTVAFLKGLNAQAGTINKTEFTNYEASSASYKTTFQRGVLIVNISTDKDGKLNGLFIKPFKENSGPKLLRNTTKLQLPFNEEWTVFWGGDTKELNYHVESEAQKNAFDMIITDKKGNSYKNNGKNNEDYYAFGKELIAPCDGEIVLSVDGIKDNIPGILNPAYALGNSVIIKTKNEEYLVFAHFKQHTIVVKQGQKVTQGELLGLCGNSGNSSEPHLHFHIQNLENFNDATGVKCYFDAIKVNGITKTDFSPIQNEKVSN